MKTANNKHVNGNYLVDISMLEEHFFEDYFGIRNMLSMYVAYVTGTTVCLCTSVDTRIDDLKGDNAFIAVLQMEDSVSNTFYDSIARNILTEKQALAVIDAPAGISKETLNAVLDNLHSAIDRPIYAAVSSVFDNYDSYVGKVVVIGVTLVNQHTLLLSLKTVGLKEGYGRTDGQM